MIAHPGVASALSLAVAALGCSTKTASQYKTSEMNAQMQARSTGGGFTDVTVSFHRPSSLLTYLQLTADDTLEASLSGDSHTMAEASLLGAVTYSARFNSEADGAQFHVKLTREIDGGAPDSFAALPAGFEPAPLAQASYSRAAPVAIAWNSGASSDPMTLEVVASCLASYKQDLGTSATSAEIPAGALTKLSGSESSSVPDECDGSILLTRTKLGTVDPAFAGGRFAGIQARALSFHSVP